MWIFLALFTAFLTSLKDVCGRKALENTDHYIVAWAWPALSVPFLLIYLLIEGAPSLGPKFWPAAAAVTVILSLASILFFRAIQISDLSASVPMLAFSPAFLLITSPLILGEFPEPLGIVGILLIVSGSYVLNFSRREDGHLEPFFYLLKNKGSRLMLCVAVLYSIGANIDKIGVLNSSPAMWMTTINILVSVVLSFVVGFCVKDPFRSGLKVWPWLTVMGFLTSIALLSQMYALRLTIVPYVIALKRTSVVMTSLFGLFVFKEKGFSERFSGAVLMIIGVFIISFFTGGQG